MSSLQVGLAVAGGLILGGVVAYNTWNARRNEPRQAQPESQPAPLVAERVEPTIDGSSGAPAPERVEPAFDTPSALQPLGVQAQLGRRLRAAQHQQGEQGQPQALASCCFRCTCNAS